ALDAFGALTGNLAATDRDTGDTLSWSGCGVGSYGTLTVNANGSYSYAVNAAAVNALQAGTNPTDSFTVTVTDAAGLTDTRTIAINVVGADATPVASALSLHDALPISALDAFGALTGNLAATDRDTGD